VGCVSLVAMKHSLVRMATRSRSSRNAPPAQTQADVQVEVQQGKAVSVHWDRTKQHTISWSEPLKFRIAGGAAAGGTAALSKGSCNLYAFPLVDGEPPTSAQVSILHELLLALARSSDEVLLPDASGATAILALLVANTAEAIELVLDMCRVRHELLTHVHLPGPFIGESALHVLAINRQEEALCTFVQLAQVHLSEEQLASLFLSQATGVFFHSEPMSHYGGTAISYAATFGLRRAIVLMISLSVRSPKMQGLLDMNHPQLACKQTGFLPVHAVVASSSPAMYDFLTTLDGIPALASARASENSLSFWGTLSQMTPLQLACRLGDHTMFTHLMHRRSELVWRWGAVAELKIDLQGIDSVGGGANDVMEIVGRIGASVTTQEFLLDSCLEGFLHKLYLTKWRRFGRAIHGALRLFELLYIVSLVSLSMWLKESPDACLEHGQWLQILVLAAAVPMIEEDLRSLVLMWDKLRTVITVASAADTERNQKSRGSCRADLIQLVHWANDNRLPVKLLGCGIGCGASAALLAGHIPYGVQQSSSPVPLWACFAIAILIAFDSFFAALIIPFQRVGVFFKTAYRVVARDVTIFLLMYFFFFCTFGLATYIAYPRIGDHQLSYHPNFNSFLSGLHELNELALLGEPSTYRLEGGVPSSGQGWYELVRRAGQQQGLPEELPVAPKESLELSVFIAIYYVYLVMTSVLLLNLLIASMNHTFSAAQTASVLEWRAMFARNVLKLEMLAGSFARMGAVDTHGGRREANGKYYVYNREHDIEAYGRDQAPDAAKPIGFFGLGLGGLADASAIECYASTFGVDVRVLHLLARRIQRAYRLRLALRAAEKNAALRQPRNAFEPVLHGHRPPPVELGEKASPWPSASALPWRFPLEA
jgi:hypothetical protein